MSGRIRRRSPGTNMLYRRCALCLGISLSSAQAEIAQYGFSTLLQREWLPQLPCQKFLIRTAHTFNVPVYRRHQIRTLSGHSEWVRCAVPSSDGKLVASCSKDQVRLVYPPDPSYCAQSQLCADSAIVGSVNGGDEIGASRA